MITCNVKKHPTTLQIALGLLIKTHKKILNHWYYYVYALCSDPTEQTLKPHYPRISGARDTVWPSFKQKHSRHDLLPMTTPGKCIEQDRPLYIVFIDFTKAFDTVGRTGLWQLLRKYGCPEKFTTMI